ncbi:MAG TPA: 4-hydroxythreonine-4-phosphate dehydrogenase PdxA [Xanthomonadales bacterium]|nr:4-hydroxythreonine-4-phosphate dehydrogenase PdxA [Xanthomonadales bacterium]
MPTLALVPGEPAGIGPELVVYLAQRSRSVRWRAFADPDCLLRAATCLGLPLRLLPEDADSGPGELAITPIEHPRLPAFGHPDPVNAASVIAALRAAGRACLDGDCAGLVTGPVHKATIQAGGIAYTGTTELLAEQAATEVVMMLAGPGRDDGGPALRVALATTHLPLRAVADAIDVAGLGRTLRILDSALRRDFGIAAPRIAVLGLNPHAGEHGLLGREEIEIIEPALDAARADGLRLIGPLPADSAFVPARLAEFDALLAMYHDQGLPVVKHAGFGRAVNVTLGLPFVRTSPDHGTAFDIAGKGIASHAMMLAALNQCAQFAAGKGFAAA